MQLERHTGLAHREGLHQVGDFLGNDVARHAHDPVRTDGHERQRERIVTAEDGELFAEGSAQLAHAIRVAAGFLDAHHRRARAGQALHRLDGDLDAAAARDAVEHERQIRGGGDGFEMLEQPFLRGLVVVGRDLERAVRARLPGHLREIDGLGGRVAAGAREHLDFPRGKFHRTLDDVDVFLVIERG